MLTENKFNFTQPPDNNNIFKIVLSKETMGQIAKLKRHKELYYEHIVQQALIRHLQGSNQA